MSRQVFVSTCFVVLVWSGLGVNADARPVPATPKPFNLKEATVLTVQMNESRTYDEVLNSLKRQGYSIEIAEKDGGQIATAFTKEKKGRARVEIVLIADSDSQTTVRIAAITQAKDFGFTAGPYDYKPPVIDSETTSGVVGKIKEDLKLP
jgi:hypothetical protein